jgi:deoxycytidylate deaminase
MDTTTIKYPYLPEGRTIILVPESDPLMQYALEVKKRSNDQLYPTGAIAVKDGKILAEASNRAGYTWKWLIRLHQKGFCPRRWFKIKTGTGYWMCRGCATAKNHAETSIVTNMEKQGRLAELGGADIYLSGHWWCCKPCWNNMIRAGIRNVYLMEGAKQKFDARTW